jgi:hypothetical protein
MKTPLAGKTPPAEAEPNAADPKVHNKASFYSARSMLAGEVVWLKDKITNLLPSDIWAW